MDEVVAAYYCALDSNTPFRAKAILFAALGYFILPTDTIPDVIFGLGFTDDIAVLTAAIAAVRAHITPAHRLPPDRRWNRPDAFQQVKLLPLSCHWVAAGTDRGSFPLGGLRGDGGVGRWCEFAPLGQKFIIW